MLDVSIRLEMLNLLDDLRTRLSLALLYITHDIASARYFADEVLVMYGGQIVERGPAEDVTQHPAHPYTQLLIASAPDPDNLGSCSGQRNAWSDRAVRLRGRPGNVGPAASRLSVQQPLPARRRQMPAGKPRPPAADARPGGGVLATGRSRLASGGRLDLKPGHSIKGKLSFRNRITLGEERSKLTTKRITARERWRLAAVGLLAAGLAACSSSTSTPSSTSSSPATARAPPVAPTPTRRRWSWSPRRRTSITENFNPFVGSAPIQGMGATGLVYEPLLQFDLANPAQKPYDGWPRATPGATAASRSPSRSARA